MNYVRTEKGEILDLENIKFKTLDNELYYKNFIFEKIRQDGNDIKLDYSAIGTEQNHLEEQRNKICSFSLIKYNDKILEQANTIGELCDEFLLIDKKQNISFIILNINNKKDYWFKYDDNDIVYELKKDEIVCGSVWIFDENNIPTLKPVAKLNNEKGVFELI